MIPGFADSHRVEIKRRSLGCEPSPDDRTLGTRQESVVESLRFAQDDSVVEVAGNERNPRWTREASSTK